MSTRVDVIFDVPETSPYYAPTIDAVRHAAGALAVDLDLRIVRTDTIDDSYERRLPDGVVIGPGAPYARAQAAEAVITTARERGIPLVGT